MWPLSTISPASSDLFGPRAVVDGVDGLEQAPRDDGGAEDERRDAREPARARDGAAMSAAATRIT